MATLPTPSVFYCDTNIYLDVADGYISESDWEEFSQSANRQVHYSFINIVELGRHIHPDEREYFDRHSRAFKALSDASDNGKHCLCDPDLDIADVYGVTIPASIGADKMHEIVKMVVQAPDLDDLIAPNESNAWDLYRRGRVVLMDSGGPGITKFGADYLRKWHRQRLDRNNQDLFIFGLWTNRRLIFN